MGAIPLGSVLLLYPVFRIGMAGQILFLEFIKNEKTDVRDEFIDGSSANQQVTLKDVYSSTVARCLSIIVNVNRTSKGFLKLDFLLDAVVYASCKNEVKMQVAALQNSGYLGYQSVLSQRMSSL